MRAVCGVAGGWFFKLGSYKYLVTTHQLAFVAASNCLLALLAQPLSAVEKRSQSEKTGTQELPTARSARS